MRKLSQQLVEQLNKEKKTLFLGNSRDFVYKVVFEATPKNHPNAWVERHYVTSKHILFDNYWEARKHLLQRGSTIEDLFTLYRAELEYEW